MLLSLSCFMLPQLTALRAICVRTLAWPQPSLLVYSLDQLPIACSHLPAWSKDHVSMGVTMSVGLLDRSWVPKPYKHVTFGCIKSSAYNTVTVGHDKVPCCANVTLAQRQNVQLS